MKNFLSRALLCGCCALSFSPLVYAQSADDADEILRLDVLARVDWQNNSVDGSTLKDNSGFEGKYLMFRLDGKIVEGLSYSWRQRFNKMHFDSSFFDATDWLYLNYAVDRWNFQAGKEIVAIGGWEYDRHPADLFASSTFWNNVPCYQLGVSVAYDISSTDRLMVQAVQSPFFTRENRNMYGYSLMWTGSHGFYSPIWSANLFEYAEGKYISYLALGNRFSFGNLALELDFMNRASSGQTFFFKDCSVMADLSWRPDRRWKVSGKFTYDVNKTEKASDLCVLPDTEMKMAGGSVEFYPLLKKRTSLRLHAGCFYSWGENANSADLWQNKSLFATVGLTWDMNLLSIRR